MGTSDGQPDRSIMMSYGPLLFGRPDTPAPYNTCARSPAQPSVQMGAQRTSLLMAADLAWLELQTPKPKGLFPNPGLRGLEEVGVSGSPRNSGTPGP